MNEEEIRAKAAARGECLAGALADGLNVLGGMTIRERYALEMMPVAAGVVERRQIASAMSVYITGLRASALPASPSSASLASLHGSRFAVGNLEEHVDEIADQAVIMADALLRRLAQP